ncbi:dnaJ (Hsp40) homolog, subfamily C, member 30b isoform X1 [Danio aesculapii]|uniref:dnaJ (Hsp40) homolog, subfamily C, member 30b isoform X1 n=1 Tax=Danio aesculapii TaxID=1142201 RepID=UPI0024BFAB40|nr:dnaJ (Hsp40) homolog, subfamily C, member 30b isoform X1 [Danio aesculapii]
MAEVTGSVRNGVNKLSAFKTLLSLHHHHHPHGPAVDSRALCRDSNVCDHWCADDCVWTLHNKHTQLHKPQISGCYTLVSAKHWCLLLGPVGSRLYSCRTADESSGPLHRSRTTYYDILKVSPNATHAQIKSAYYKQSFIYHPDRNRSEDAARQFALVAEAYSVLGRSSLRRRYDRGILTQTEVQSSGKPAAPQPPRRAPPSGKTAYFDFDAFYQAHYGEQLQREKLQRLRQQQIQQRRMEMQKQWRQEKITGVSVILLLLFGGVIINSLKS